MINTTYIDQKYIQFLSGRLRGFVSKSNGSYEFAHHCESPTSRKKRGYFYKKGTGYNFYCHNCQESTKFFKFLQKEDPSFYKDYQMELFKESMSTDRIVDIEDIVVPKKDDVVIETRDIQGLIPYSELPTTHPAWKYVLKRKIPTKFYSDIYFCKDFYPWATTFAKAFEKVKIKEPRLVIPYRNMKGGVVGFTCRSYGNSDRKYIELKLDPDNEMIYGLDRINISKSILSVEGSIDSMFLDNAVAVGGASYTGNFFNKYKHNIIIVPDNDWKRNRDVLKKIEQLAEAGYKVALLPDSFTEKDINEAIVRGKYTSAQVMALISASVKFGPELILDIAFRRKC